MISARLLLILHKYAGIYMGASAQGGRTLASEKFGTGLPGWSGLGWLGQSWPRAAGQSQGPLSGHSAQTIFAPSSVRSADWKFRAWKIPSKLSASNWKCINIFFPTFLLLKFIYSEKATKFCEIFTLLLSYIVPVKSKVKISQNFVAFSEYMNFKIWWRLLTHLVYYNTYLDFSA